MSNLFFEINMTQWGNRKNVSTLDGNFGYKYDSIYQLTESKVNSLTSEVYQYDSVGNRLKARGSGADDNVYDSSNRLLTLQPTASNPQPVSFTYDNNGSRLTKLESDSTTSYTYDYENRLKRIDFADSSYAEYTYDALGRRIAKKVFTTNDEIRL